MQSVRYGSSHWLPSLCWLLPSHVVPATYRPLFHKRLHVRPTNRFLLSDPGYRSRIVWNTSFRSFRSSAEMVLLPAMILLIILAPSKRCEITIGVFRSSFIASKHFVRKLFYIDVRSSCGSDFFQTVYCFHQSAQSLFCCLQGFVAEIHRDCGSVPVG